MKCIRDRSQLVEIYAKKNFNMGDIKRKRCVDNLLKNFTIVFFKISYYIVNGQDEIFNLDLIHEFFLAIITEVRFFNLKTVVNEITLVDVMNKKSCAKFTFTSSITPTVAKKKGDCKS